VSPVFVSPVFRISVSKNAKFVRVCITVVIQKKDKKLKSVGTENLQQHNHRIRYITIASTAAVIVIVMIVDFVVVQVVVMIFCICFHISLSCSNVY